MRMISNFWKISKSGATAVRAQSLTFYAPPRDSIAIPASLMRGECAGPPCGSHQPACNASQEFARGVSAPHFGLYLRTHIELKAENNRTHLAHLAHAAVGAQWITLPAFNPTQKMNAAKLKIKTSLAGYPFTPPPSRSLYFPRG